MKKILIIPAILFIALNVNAQWFLGGNLGFQVSIQGSREKEKLMPYQSRIGFSIAPKFGYYFNEKLAAGLDLAVGPTFTEETQTTYYYDSWGNQYPYTYSFQGIYLHWRFAPFLRYSVFTHKKFALMLEGSLGAAGSHVQRTFDPSLPFHDEKYSIFGIGILNIVPVLGYKLTDHLQLEAQLNFLNLGYNMDIYLYEGESSKSTDIKHDFNIGINARSVFVVSHLTVGAIYKF